MRNLRGQPFDFIIIFLVRRERSGDRKCISCSQAREVMGDFRKKILQTDFKGKISCMELPGKKIPALKKHLSLIAYNAGKKNLTPLYVGEKKFYL